MGKSSIKRAGTGLLALALLLTATMAQAAQKITLIMTDAQGTVVMTKDAQGNILSRSNYRPYGAPLDAPQDGPGYTGHVNDADTGLVYMQQRYYDPESQRFASADPVGPSPGGLFDFNRYDYANNNPIVNTDPTGMDCNREDSPCNRFIDPPSCDVECHRARNDARNRRENQVYGNSIIRLHGTKAPHDAVLYKTGNGGYYFYAPKRANWAATYTAGYVNGPNPIGAAAAVGQGGMYDFQREDGQRLPAYVNLINPLPQPRIA